MSAFSLIGLFQATQAVDWYVATDGTGLGTNGWANATNNLQGAITNPAVLAGDTIWVSNGVYNTGGVTNYPAGSAQTTRVVITKAITVRSKDNDPANTIIKGAWDPNTNGPAAVRCVYMAAGSSLIGFTITNGATLLSAADDTRVCGGGIFCPSIATPVISNCIITGNSAYGGGNYKGGGGAWYGSLYNCSLVGNMAFGGSNPFGGGALYSYLYNCTLIGNSAVRGGGVSWGTLSNCMLTANTTSGSISDGGAGAYRCTLYNCNLISNQANGLTYGGGAMLSTLYNCVLTGNTTSQSGGGANQGALYNCLLTGNYSSYGGGASGATLYNCTVVGNTGAGSNPSYQGGGVHGSTLYNCVVYFNSSTTPKENWQPGCTFAYSCTLPDPGGVGNTTNDPNLINKGSGYGTNHVAGNYRLFANSPCINAGTYYAWMTDGSVTSRDLDGQRRIRYGTVDMGPFENIRSGNIYGFR